MSGYWLQDVSNFLRPINTTGEIDMNWQIDGSGFLRPIVAIEPVFPPANDTVTRAGSFGWAGEFIANFVKPAAAQVQQGVWFGANGTEFFGTFSGGVGPAPATPELKVVDAQDGQSATATVSLADAGTTNRIYIEPIGSGYQNPIFAGTITGNGSLTIYGLIGDYSSYAMSTIGTSAPAIGIGNIFQISAQSTNRTEVRDAGADAHLEVCKEFGIRVDYMVRKSDASWTPVYAMDITSQDTVSIHGSSLTDVRRATLEIPVQYGFPPTSGKMQAQSLFRIPAGEDGFVFGVEDTDSLNANIGIKSIFTVHLMRLDYDSRIGGNSS
jgi:hypothetical protein